MGLSRSVAGQLNSKFLEGINEAVEENLESGGGKRYLLSQKLNMNYLFLCPMQALQHNIQGNCLFKKMLLTSFTLYIPRLAIMTCVVLTLKSCL